jgi:hypothetical protein
MFAPFQSDMIFTLAFGAFQSQDDFLGGLGFLSENGLGLTAVTLLFPIVTTTTLSHLPLFALFVLRHFVRFVHPAFLAEGLSRLGHVHLV